MLRASAKAYLKRFPAVVALRHRLSHALGMARHGAAEAPTDSSLRRAFAAIDADNVPSLNFSHGLVEGRCNGVPFLLQMRVGGFIESSIYVHGIWEGHVSRLISGYLHQPGGLMIDVGANIGATSVPLARGFAPTEFCLFEPHPEVFRTLSSNIALNGLCNVRAHNLAVSDSADLTIDFYAQKGSANMGLSSTRLNPDIEHYDCIKVRSVRLDDHFRDYEGRISVIKIDTQGNELDVLESARAIVAKHRPVVVFEHEDEYFPDEAERNETKRRIARYFADLQYGLYAIGAGSGFKPELNLGESYFHGEIVAVPFALAPALA
jgi:FkbM family methyltransferase